jgi:hypothetical protein
MTRRTRRYKRSSVELAAHHTARAIRVTLDAQLAAERARQYESARHFEHVARQLVAQYDHLSGAMPVLRTQSYSEVTA